MFYFTRITFCTVWSIVAPKVLV